MYAHTAIVQFSGHGTGVDVKRGVLVATVVAVTDVAEGVLGPGVSVGSTLVGVPVGVSTGVGVGPVGVGPVGVGGGGVEVAGTSVGVSVEGTDVGVDSFGVFVGRGVTVPGGIVGGSIVKIIVGSGVKISVAWSGSADSAPRSPEPVLPKRTPTPIIKATNDSARTRRSRREKVPLILIDVIRYWFV